MVGAEVPASSRLVSMGTRPGKRSEETQETTPGRVGLGSSLPLTSYVV